MEYLKLNNNQQIPIIGTGTNTYGKENNEYQGKLNNDFSALKTAIDNGYRLIDAAVSYRNEAGVGQTIKNSRIPREEFFITTKIPRIDYNEFSKEKIQAIVNNSLENFHTEYIDLYLIHHPIENTIQLKETWSVLEHFYNQGIIKNIGVSNFDQNILDKLINFAHVKPVVNQIEINLKNTNIDLIRYLKEKNIIPIAWGPMNASDIQKEGLNKIGQKYDKSWAQILLKYQIQQEIVVIPKSHQSNNQVDNLNIFDFVLSKKEMKTIQDLSKNNG